MEELCEVQSENLQFHCGNPCKGWSMIVSPKRENKWDLWNVKSIWLDDQFCMSGKRECQIKNDAEFVVLGN